MSSLTDQALNTQLALVRWSETDIARRYLQAMMDQQQAMLGDIPPWDGAALRNAVRSTLYQAEAFAVTDDMVELLESAMTTLPDFELSPADVPEDFGFVYFERGIVIPDRKFRPVVIKAFTWGKAASYDVINDSAQGVWIALWTDPEDSRDMNYLDFRDVPPSVRGPLVFLSDFPWLYGDSWHQLVQTTLEDLTIEQAQEVDQTTKCIRMIGSFFRLVMEPWIDQSRYEPSRHVRRRRERSKLVPQQGVRVITLRKAREGYVPPASGDIHDEEPRYSHRWLVRGHWRNQWYPSERRHAPKWIAPYIKGPEDKPLVIHDHVYEWRR